jgi:sporadic carbohydrate cluster 2OG-Fe(II) oxygenase
MELENKNNKEICNIFLKKGYLIKDIKNRGSLEWISNECKKIVLKLLNIKKTKVNDQDLFNQIHKYIKIRDLNKFRLEIYNNINKINEFKYHYYSIARENLDLLVGNELVMQSRINLSIQCPQDNSSLLPMHADTWSGVSPYEIVVWLPLVDCYKTKTMYFMKSNKMHLIKKLFKNNNLSPKNIFSKIRNEIEWLNVKYGQVLIFDQSIPHGNIVNKENETRWSMNCRFKSVFSPYADKKIGEFFEPITLKPVTIKALNYKYPK